jgi:hypothetical protein
MNRCEECRYWVKGECHREAPGAVMVVRPKAGEVTELKTLWPTTEATDGCGEWKKREK